MTESKHNHGPGGQGGSGRQANAHAHADHGPYWKRAHHDWRVWAGVLLMLIAMSIYVMRNGLIGQPRILPPPAGNVNR